MMALVIGNLLVGVSAVLALWFMIAYHRRSRGAWRRNPIGRHVMAFVGADAAVLGLATVRAVFGASLDVAWFVWLRIAVFLGVPFVLGWRLLILYRVTSAQPEASRDAASFRPAEPR